MVSRKYLPFQGVTDIVGLHFGISAKNLLVLEIHGYKLNHTLSVAVKSSKDSFNHHIFGK